MADHMAANKTKRALREGQVALGASMASASSLMAEVLGGQGIDFVLVDLQHGETNVGDVQRLVHAVLTTGATPLVRVPGNDSILVQRCLDLGAYGIIVPYVNTVEMARAVVQAARYPPLGQRSCGPARGAFYLASDYFQRANEELLVVVMLETRQAAENAGAILAVEGVDGCIIGPNDLAISYGHPSGLPQPPPDAEQGVQRVLAAAKQTGKFAGMFLSGAREANRRIEQGFRFLSVASDVRIAATGLQALLTEIRR
ncbi:MAG: 2,4-dihydroxyhept-2-ene-1,7-dioic acid aldolase [Chloroflexi bacterium]|nr:2,4-dihydroxyhept-2-ene-1,7-dioic acid aldolase [Chloroflexota bacterium]